MRSRKVLVVAGFITTWTFITYYFLLRQNPDFSFHRLTLRRKIDLLENGAKEQYEASNKLFHSLISILRNKIEADSQIGQNGPLVAPQLEDTGGNGPSAIIGVKEIPLDTSAEKASAVPVAVRTADGKPVIPVLVFACNRVSISNCLDNLIQYRPSAEQFPIIVSQDCGDEMTKKVILSYQEQLTLIEQPDTSDIYVPPKEKKFKGYYKISRHYGWALNTTFQKGYEYVIIVEDDLNVAPDFYEYFFGTYTLLKNDPSLWCISAWNDNGKIGLIDTEKPELLYRTDFFPGLGWMLTKELWSELSVKWPKSFWDDWIRHPEQRKNRVCIRPEISRTRTFGKVGVSNGLFFDKYLKHIKLSEDFVEFTKMNLSYLLKDNYDKTFIKNVYDCPMVTYEELRRNLISLEGPVRIQYSTKEQYKRTTKLLGLMDDFKSGVPRTGYHGIVSFYFNKRRVYLAPNLNWKGYDLSWS